MNEKLNLLQDENCEIEYPYAKIKKGIFSRKQVGKGSLYITNKRLINYVDSPKKRSRSEIDINKVKGVEISKSSGVNTALLIVLFALIALYIAMNIFGRRLTIAGVENINTESVPAYAIVLSYFMNIFMWIILASIIGIFFELISTRKAYYVVFKTTMVNDLFAIGAECVSKAKKKNIKIKFKLLKEAETMANEVMASIISIQDKNKQ